jgi:alkanesulfonate monooxygenase SsuD/methylene tetrahydromethanopterin reductase-like flavin-dependent oxidoreductase (luciferase family)
MKFGTNIITSNRRGSPPSAVLSEWVDSAVEAERLGYWSVWTTEHHFASDPGYRPFDLSEEEYPHTDYDMASDPMTLLTYAAAKTSRVKIGTAVAIVHWDHPIRMVERAALLDALSGGRLEFGVGRGLGFRETDVFGVPTDPEANARRYHEAIEIIRRAWSGERFSFEGEFYNVPTLAITPQPERQPAPLFVGSASNDSAIWAAKNDLPYATITWPLVGVDVYRDKRAAYLAAGEEAGFDLADRANPHFLYLYCGETDEEAAAVVEEYMSQFQYVLEGHYEHTRPREQNKMMTSGFKYAGRDDDPFADIRKLAKYPVESHIVGSPETCIERVRAYKEDVGVNYIVLNMRYGGMPQDLHLASMRRFAEKVMPEFPEDS